MITFLLSPLGSPRRRLIPFSLLLAVLTVSAIFATNLSKAGQETTVYLDRSYEEAWREVEKLDEKDLPKDALPIVEDILMQARRERNEQQQCRALLYITKYTAALSEEGQLSAIEKLEGESRQSKGIVAAVSQIYLAQLYESYFQREQYKITNRTAGAIVSEGDVATWDLQRFATRIRSLHEQALADEKLLQNARIEDYPIILSLAEDQDRSYQSTLFEVLLSEVVKQKQNSRVLALANISQRFWVDGPEYFSLGEDFRRLPLPQIDSLSPAYQTLQLEQKLVDFLVRSDSKAALAYADLSRLLYIQQQSSLDNSLELLIAALQELAESNTDTELYTRIISSWGFALLQQSDDYDVMKPEQRPELRDQRKKILLALDAAIDAFPDSEGAKDCRNLKAEIRQRELEIELPEVTYPGEEILGTLRFKNLSQVDYEIWKCDFENWTAHLDRYRATDWDKILKNSSQVRSSRIGLNDPGDHYAHRTHFPLEKLDAGYYILVARDAEKDKDMDPVYSPFQVSKLGQLTAESTDGGLDVFVRDRKKGTAVSDARVQVLNTDNSRKSSGQLLVEQTVDKDGYTRFYSDWNSYRNHLRLLSGDSELLITEPLHISRRRQQREVEPYMRTIFFTDRSIYRPGQTISFKGVQYIGKENPVAVNEDAEVIVEIRGPNNTSISTLTFRTNEFGSFAGSFVAPAGLTGNYYIRSTTGSTSISVEEYKRPRFEVEIDPLEGQAELDKQVQVSGKASTYSGVPVQEAKVSWRVVREPSYPWWWWRCWTGGFDRESSTQVASGIGTTNEEGVFELEFKALAGTNEGVPQYRFRIYADVTDISGETRSGSNAVTIARSSVSLGVELADQIDLRNSPDLKVLATNADGQAVAIKGTARIKKLTPHNRLLYPDLLDPVDQPMLPIKEFRNLYPHQPYVDLESEEAREPLRPIWEKDFETSDEDAQGFDLGDLPTQRWSPGEYMFHVFTTDASGQLVEFKRYFTLYDSESRKLPMQLFSWLEASAESAIPGETMRYRFGTSLSVPVLFEVRHRNKIIQQQWVDMKGNIEEFEIPVTEDHRSGLDVEFVYVAEGRVHREHHHLDVPWTNKELRLSMETMRSVLRPGAEETWTVKVEAVEGESGPIEMMALMYDASLDAIRPHQIDRPVYFQIYPPSPRWYQTAMFGTSSKSEQSTYEIPWGKAVQQNWLNWYNTHQVFTYGWMGAVGDIRMMASPMAESVEFRSDDGEAITEQVALGNASIRRNYKSQGLSGLVDNANQGKFKSDSRNPESPAEAAEPAIRKNLQETAFFYPQLHADKDGRISFSFNSPEALTRWNILGMAHTPGLQSGTLKESVVTRKELMVTPNFPRFFREGDVIVVTAKIDNTSEDTLSGGAVLEVYDAITEAPAAEQLGLIEARRAWSAEAGKSTLVSWRIKVPDSGLGAVRYVVRASAGNFSDGEEHIAPVLTDRILVTESMAMAIPGAGEFEFEMDKLRRSKNVQHQLVAVEFSSNPAWYAVQSLPYLMEYPHDCNEQIFSRYYANSIAGHLANSDPSIARVFEQWKGTDALLSNLEKNEDLKRILIEETPWLQEAQSESARKQRVGILFDLVRMETESRKALGKLFQNQSPSGGWPWFSGGQESSYITQHILAGFGQLNRMGLETTPEVEGMLIRAVNFVDRETGRYYDDLKKSPEFEVKEYVPSAWVVHYLYMRSFYDQKSVRNDALKFFLDRAEATWLEKGEYERGMIALALHRLRPQSEIPNDILKSLSQNSQRDAELGMYWPDVTRGYYWYQRPIETQSLLIEAYHEIAEDSDAVEAMKLWLLKNKQTSDWGTTKATAKACYALLGTGRNLLLSRELVQVQAGSKLIDPYETIGGVEAGTGYFRHNFGTAEINGELASVTVKKKDEGIAWGAMHWQYFTDLDKVESAGGALSISKEIYKKVNSEAGPKLVPLKEEALKVGDRVVVRLVMETDRELEFVHLKDGRASGLEPRDVISGHRWQGGMSYYQSTRDASTNFFLDRLRPGKWVFEYELTAFQAGDFSAGPAEVQCMYAPEFNAHSDGFRVRVEAD